MFTDVFLVTTDPTRTVSQIFSSQILLKIIFSIVFHTIIYVGFFNLASFIFLGSPLSQPVNRRLVIAALTIMTLGYLGRMYHVREIYRAYQGDAAKTREHVNKLFISWVFIG